MTGSTSLSLSRPSSNTGREEQRLLLDRAAKEAASTVRKTVSRNGSILLITHFDADGLSAGSVVLSAVGRLGTSAHLRVVDSMTEKVLEDARKVDADLVIFSDIGSGYLDQIGKQLADREVVIVDHHQSLGEPAGNIRHFNPHSVGFDGATEISGAGTAYLLAKAINPSNVDLSAVALVGALGDQQDKGAKRSFIGLNQTILKDAVDTGVVEATQDLIFYGRQTRPIYKAIASTTSPYLPGLSGEEDKCLALLDNAGVATKMDDRWRTISDLSLEEKRRIVERIVHHVISLKVSGEVVLDMIGWVYTLAKEDAWTPLRDAREYSALLNACGRMQKPGLGIALGMGDRGVAFEEAQSLYNEYRKQLAKYMNWLTSDPSVLQHVGPLVVIRGEGVIPETMTGAVSSLVSSSNLFGDSRVTIVGTDTSTGEYKLSTRGTDLLVSKGLNLGRLLQSLAEKHGGNGGGHTIAAGATIERDKVDQFINEMSSHVKLILN